MKRLRTTEHAPTACPRCGYVVDNATSAMKENPRAKARPGCLGVCLRCGAVNVYTAEMQLEPFDVTTLGPEDTRLVRRLQDMIARKRPS